MENQHGSPQTVKTDITMGPPGAEGGGFSPEATVASDGMAAAFLLWGCPERGQGALSSGLWGASSSQEQVSSGSCHWGFGRTLTPQVGPVPTPVFWQMPPLPPPTLSVCSRGRLLPLEGRAGRWAGLTAPLTTLPVSSPLAPVNPGNGTPVSPKHAWALTLLRGQLPGEPVTPCPSPGRPCSSTLSFTWGPGPHPAFRSIWSEWVQESAFLTSSQVMPMLLI